MHPSEETINLVFNLFTDPTYVASFPLHEQTWECVYSMVRSWEAGTIFFWLATDRDIPMAVFHGRNMNLYQFEIHQLVLKNFWGKSNWPKQVEASNQVIDEIFRGSPKTRQITGYTPMTNPLAIKFAERGGFTKVGEMPEYFEYLDGNVNAAIMVRTRRAS